MWDDLLRVDWAQLGHAYGSASDVPKILCDMISADPKTREEGWQLFDDSLNHQGSCYNSTRAALPFLVEAVGNPEVPVRTRLLEYFRKRWLEAPIQGGDLPMSTEGEPAVASSGRDLSRYQREDLCAWQVGRAIWAGRSTYERLADDPDRAVAAAAAELLLLSPESRAHGKRVLVRTIEEEPDPIEQARRILEYGVYGESADAGLYERWVDPGRPGVVRAAAGIAWAWMVDSDPPPRPAARALHETSADASDAFAQLPWVGLWWRGPWILPTHEVGLILRLAGNQNGKLRRWAVEGLNLAYGREAVKHLPDLRAVPVLIERLSDEDPGVRKAAVRALSRRGGVVFAIDPLVVPALIRLLDDDDPSALGHAARLLVALSDRLTAAQRAGAIAGMERAATRFRGREVGSTIWFDPGLREATPYLEEQLERIRKPTPWGLRDLFAEIAILGSGDEALLSIECDRRLARAFAEDPSGVLAAAIEAVRDEGDRNGSLGAANWLATLGPAAAPALLALEAMGRREKDPFVQERAREAIGFIRRSMETLPEPAESIIADQVSALEDPDPIVRARATARIGSMPADGLAVAALVRLLNDEASALVGIEGPFVFRGQLDPGDRLHHWHLKRWCPRAEAIRALVRLDRIPDGDRMLRALIAESMHAEIICARRAAAPHRFEIGAWRSTVAAAGGAPAAEAAIRAARDRCRDWAGSGQDKEGAAFACRAELEEVLRRLSGRLGGGR